MGKKAIKTIAYHEAGHILITYLEGNIIYKASIVPKIVVKNRQRYKEDGGVDIGPNARGGMRLMSNAKISLAGLAAEVLFTSMSRRQATLDSPDDVLQAKRSLKRLHPEWTPKQLKQLEDKLWRDVSTSLKRLKPLIKHLVDDLIEHGKLSRRAIEKIIFD